MFRTDTLNLSKLQSLLQRASNGSYLLTVDVQPGAENEENEFVKQDAAALEKWTTDEGPYCVTDLGRSLLRGQSGAGAILLARECGRLRRLSSAHLDENGTPSTEVEQVCDVISHFLGVGLGRIGTLYSPDGTRAVLQLVRHENIHRELDELSRLILDYIVMTRGKITELINQHGESTQLCTKAYDLWKLLMQPVNDIFVRIGVLHAVLMVLADNGVEVGKSSFQKPGMVPNLTSSLQESMKIVTSLRTLSAAGWPEQWNEGYKHDIGFVWRRLAPRITQEIQQIPLSNAIDKLPDTLTACLVAAVP